MLQEKTEHKIITFIYRIEGVIVTALLSSILLLAISQIILRNFYNSGFIWADSILRILVLWLGLTGAVLASRHGKQINIDILSQYLPDKVKKYVDIFNTMFTASICLIISYYSFQFVVLEYHDGIYVFEKIPAWLTEIIIPISFLVMAIKYIVQIFSKNLFKSNR